MAKKNINLGELSYKFFLIASNNSISQAKISGSLSRSSHLDTTFSPSRSFLISGMIETSLSRLEIDILVNRKQMSWTTFRCICFLYSSPPLAQISFVRWGKQFEWTQHLSIVSTVIESQLFFTRRAASETFAEHPKRRPFLPFLA